MAHRTGTRRIPTPTRDLFPMCSCRGLRRGVVVLWSMALLVLALAGPASANVWTDITDAQWQDVYKISAQQADVVADGFPGGAFRPFDPVTRGQFTKMSVDGLDVVKLNPATPTFTDVPRSHIFFQHIEGAADDELIGGFGDGTFRPGNKITRQQTNSILGRYLSGVELSTKGYIQVGNDPRFRYSSLEAWFAAEGEFYLAGYSDNGQVLAAHRPGTAYLVARDVVLGSGGKLTPNADLGRAQAVALVVRTDETVADVSTPPPAPTNLATMPTSPSRDARPFVTGRTIADGRVAVYDTFGGTTAEIIQGTADATGDFSIRVPTLLEGTHSFTVKVKDENGLISAASAPVQYVLDLTAPEGDIEDPEDEGAVNSRKPVFTVAATDPGGSGVVSVTFAYRATGAATFTTISTDSVPQAGFYEAAWGDITLPDGTYQLQATVRDNADNATLLGPIEVTVDLEPPTVVLEEPSAAGIAFVGDPQPLFLASAADAPAPATPGAVASGIERVDFFYALASGLPADPDDWDAQDFTLFSSDDKAEARAVWGDLELDDGHYVFAVRSVDRAGNESDLDTQAVVIDTASPVASISAPASGARVAGGEPYTITWTVTDAYLPADPITLEYTLNDGVDWVVIAAATANDGSHVWSVPGGAADVVGTVRVRLTATDGFGDPTVVTTGLFTIDNTDPAAPTGVTHTDTDTNPGIDGRDFEVHWTPSASTDVSAQRIYIVPSSDPLDLEGPDAHSPVVTIAGNTATSWTGTPGLGTDSGGDPFSLAIPYQVYVVAVDQAGRMGVSTPATWALPEAPVVTATDDNDTTAGIDGRDFRVDWTPSATADVTAQRVYILPQTTTTLVLVGAGAHAPVATTDDETLNTWVGPDTLVVDSAGAALAAGAYHLFVVAVDEDGRMRASDGADLTVDAP